MLSTLLTKLADHLENQQQTIRKKLRLSTHGRPLKSFNLYYEALPGDKELTKLMRKTK